MSDSAYHWMQQAIILSESARLHAPPNPWVGCIIVKNHQLIGQGYTQPPGQAHAEIVALRQAAHHAKGATLYTTLEPCAHTGRTPPCTQAIIQAGIREVYIGITDPDQRVCGRGIAQLQKAGIKTFTGICEEGIKKHLAPYLYHRQTQLPYTILKSAISLDGRTAAADLTSQWITCSSARQDVHLQRAYSQAILIGSGTALKDNPQLTVRQSHIQLKTQPLRVILDSRGQVNATGALFDCEIAPTLVLTTSDCPKNRIIEWQSKGAEVEIMPSSHKGIHLPSVWHLLGQRSVLQVLVEGGSTLHTALLDTSLVNRLLIYMGPLLLGSTGHPFYQTKIATLQQAKHLKLQEVKQIGDCARLDYQMVNTL